ncbi:MAG: HEPN domain-containing protein [Duncaniella sp.]|nr:HEPN domain-containing protein [Duncaniella sp.]
MTPEIRAEIVRYRISKAHQLLVEIRKMMELEMWNSAVNRMYYACFHSASALLIKKVLIHIPTKDYARISMPI